MKALIEIVQIIVSLLLVGVILIQAQGTGLGRAWGNSGQFHASKRGVEKFVLWLTVFLAFVFFATSLLNFVY